MKHYTVTIRGVKLNKVPELLTWITQNGCSLKEMRERNTVADKPKRKRKLLSDEEIRDIRGNLANLNGECTARDYKELASHYGCSPLTIERVHKGQGRYANG